jgi:protein-S-isoprenylcysteine O-methyltransferase Ste14
LGLIFLPLVYLLTPWLDFADYRLPAWAGWAGAAVFAAALWLLWRSHADLGRHWSATLQVQQEHSLVTQGVYRSIRHPMYAAHWLWAVAQALLLQNWIAGPSMLVTFLPSYLVRVPREEQMMLDHFGQEYRQYMQRTGRVVPRVWK